MKSKVIGQRLIQKYLYESVFNPKLPGPLQIIVDIHDSNYYEVRAIELIQEARLINNHEPKKINDNEAKEIYHIKMKQAISLLALARAENGAIEIQK